MSWRLNFCQRQISMESWANSRAKSAVMLMLVPREACLALYPLYPFFIATHWTDAYQL